jgi:UDP-N-acetylglucosamine acyltransferase
VSPGARLADGVRVEPYAVIGDGVELGRGTSVGSHAQLEGPAVFGEDNRIFPHAVLGFEPQDLKYRGERTRLVVGSGNVFREFSTVHRGTATGRGETTIGDGNYFMAGSHVAHDGRVGSWTVFANCASLAGHAQCRQDVLPFCKTDGIDAKTYGINTIGLKRQDFSEETIAALQKAYRFLVKSKLNTTQAIERIQAEIVGVAAVDELVTFIRESKRGFHR